MPLRAIYRLSRKHRARDGTISRPPDIYIQKKQEVTATHWNDDVKYVKGVGPRRAELLAKLSVRTAGGLLGLYPRAYIDFSNPSTVAAAPFHEAAAVQATVFAILPERRISGGRTLVKVECGDETAALDIVFFNNPYIAKKLAVGEEYVFYGKTGGTFAKREMTSPVFLPAGSGAPLSAVYPLTAGLSSAVLSKSVRHALDGVDDIYEPLPQGLLQKYAMPGKREALEKIHFPASFGEVKDARRRLVFEELFCLQLGLLQMKNREIKEDALPLKITKPTPFFAALPYKPTSAQKRSIDEIFADMTGKSPMNRLLQGDVGSGKTLVAAAAIWLAAQNGYQSTLMAPTEILARQHADTLEKLLAPLGISVALLTSAVKGAARKQVLAAIACGAAQLVVGTHAVLSDPVEFQNLGLAVTDEQHRFGVRQRAGLAQKAKNPHLLVMSATPIPRTMALLMFGDLDISVLDEMPPGRTPVKTYAVTGKKREDMFGFLAKEISEGRQVYIVCPLIEEGETDLLAATAYLEDIAKPLLPKARIGLMHGRLKAAEKEDVMNAFRAGKLDVLVSTTVIEVGVDVPNASVMVIEDAERYGLSALHQLRGRVGRGAAESYCVLVSDHAGEAARERLRFLCRTADGFEVARYDLETRGPGDFFGNRQHGLPDLKIADFAADTRVLKAAQEEAIALSAADPKLAAPQHAGLRQAVKELFQGEYSMN